MTALLGERKSILIVDDEEHTVGKLEELLRGCRGSESCYDYASTLDDAIRYLKENSYSGIVIGFNTGNLNGKQLLSLLKGEFYRDGRLEAHAGNDVFVFEDVSDEDVRAVLKENFESVREYREFVAKYQYRALVMFSGHALGDGVDDQISDGTHVEVKNLDDPRDYSAERCILEYFVVNGVLRQSEVGKRDIPKNDSEKQ